VIETAGNGHGCLKRIFAGMPKGRMTQVMRQAKRFGQVFVKPERSCHGPADLRYLDTMGQADPIMISVGSDEDLRLVTESAEGDGMDDAVAIALEDVARASRRPIGFWMGPAAGCAGVRGK
jgi:hypothetical protein